MVILSYHRITDAACDPWGLCVTPEHFGAHMDVVRAEATPLPLSGLVPASRSDRAPARGVVVTFDDGYVDNLTDAKPHLERAGVPATVFVATGYVDSGHEFWWDVLQGLLLERTTLPPVLTLDINGVPGTWALSTSADLDRHELDACRAWRAWTAPPTSRHALYLAVWQLLRPLAEAPRLEILERLTAWADTCGTGRVDDHARRSPNRAATRAELRALASGGLVTLGAHTVTHPMLSLLTAEAKRQEVDASRQAVEAITGEPVSSFAYPYGDVDADTLAAVRQSGLTLACAGGPGRVDEASDPLRLPRVQVEDWDAAEFRRRLSDWFRD